MMLEAYEQAIENTVSPRMVSCYEQRAKGELFSRGDVLNEPRNVAMFLARLLSGERVGAIGRQFGVGKYSSARSAIEKMKKNI